MRVVPALASPRRVPADQLPAALVAAGARRGDLIGVAPGDVLAVSLSGGEAFVTDDPWQGGAF
ncbi:MAG TPA: hypothetical protein DCR14_07980, partial [Acidimicrobiaceae bacterium]|nr:hypothetical protein [Acidimicrobiaceae bacterium]